MQYPNAWLYISGFLASLLVVGGCASTETAPPQGAATSTAIPQATSTPTTTKSNKVNINKAPIAELDKLELPGTKPSLSERIEAGRPYATPEDLVKKKAISDEEFKLIKNLVAVEDKK